MSVPILSRQRILVGLIAILACFPLYRTQPASAADQESSAATVLSFKDFYEKVSAYYPKLKQQDENVNSAIIRKLQAAAGFLPSAQLSASVTHGDDPVYVFGALLRESRFTSSNFELSTLNSPSPHTTYGAAITGQMPIFDALQTISKVRSAKLQIDSTQYDADFTRMEAFLVASEAYLRAVAIDKLLLTVNDVSQASAEDVQQAEDLKNQGLILGADFYTAKVALGNMNQLKNQLLQEKQASHILLNILMGEDPLKPFELPKAPGAIARDNAPLQAWLENAFKFRPDLAALDKIIQAQGIEVKREKSTVLPRLDAFGEARQDTANFSSVGGQNFIVGAKAQIDLFDPSYASRVRLSKSNLKKLEYDQVILKDRIASDLAQEFARYQSTQDNLPVIQDMLEDAKQAVDLTRPLYQEGRKSIADLLAIRSAYLNTARGFYALDTDSKASWTRLLYLSGQLDEPHINAVINAIGE